MVSVIIPTYNNKHLLYAHLDKYTHQHCHKFEIIVVNDGGESINYESPFVRVLNQEDNRGPAAARNLGAREARFDRVLFVGDDCFPSRDLILRHAIFHLNNPHVALQGYTPFHPDVMDTPFMWWLDKSGMQAAWQNLRDGDGWKTTATGFLLTTNFSINRDDFLNLGGFPEVFPTAAWEDVCLGHTLNKFGYQTAFDPNAVNLHYHKHTMTSFLQRQIREGRSRPLLVEIYPEFANGLLNPNDLRGSESFSIEENFAMLSRLQYIPQANIHEQMSRLMLAGSYQGAREIIEQHPIMRVLAHVNDLEFPAYIFTAIKGLKEGNVGYVEHCIEWALQKEPGNWATHAFAGECYLAIEKPTDALIAFKRSIELSTSNQWVIDRYNEFIVS